MKDKAEKIRIIFVGLHNKPGLKPLDSKSKSGKLIDRIIQVIPKDIEVVKSNLFNIDEMPLYEELHDLLEQWYWTYLPVDSDIIILLGATVHERFPEQYQGRIVKIAHPASKRSMDEMNDYVYKAVKKIKSLIKERSDK